MKFVIHKSDAKFYYFVLIGEDLMTLFISVMYKNKEACLKGIDQKKDKMLAEAVQALKAKIIDEE